ncbi:ATP-binding protein, partial [Haemophilus parainfluenzae]|uniref:ATP-binding protein n=1 Tax=Haemophilus parainfluenzae TaxID=729 RepID=UPI001788BBAF
SQMAGENTTIRIHASRKGEMLHLAVWLSNPWMGDGLPPAALRMTHLLHPDYQPTVDELWRGTAEHPPFSNNLQDPDHSIQFQLHRDMLGLLLSQHIATLHQGRITVQGTADGGYRFVVELPALE